MKKITNSIITGQLLMAGILIFTSSGAIGAPIAYYRFDEVGAVDGNVLVGADIVSEYNPGVFNSVTVSSTPQYSTNVPGAFIKEGSTGPTYANNFSLYAPDPGSGKKIITPHDVLLDQASFTIEFFYAPENEPEGAQPPFSRFVDGENKLNIEFDHSANTSRYGGLRVLSNNASPSSSVMLRSSDGVGGQIFVDSDGNTDDPSDYPGGDPFPLGNGVNDFTDNNPGQLDWHHIAFTYNDSTGIGNFYIDGILMDTGNIAGLMNTSLAAGFSIGMGGGTGKTGSGYVDEFRFSNVDLAPAEFLQIVIPESSTYTAILGALSFGIAIFIRRRR